MKTSLFADDGALWVTHKNLTHALAIVQQALNTIKEWSHLWGLKKSAAKITAVIFTMHHPNRPLPLKVSCSLSRADNQSFVLYIYDVMNCNL